MKEVLGFTQQQFNGLTVDELRKKDFIVQVDDVRKAGTLIFVDYDIDGGYNHVMTYDYFDNEKNDDCIITTLGYDMRFRKDAKEWGKRKNTHYSNGKNIIQKPQTTIGMAKLIGDKYIENMEDIDEEDDKSCSYDCNRYHKYTMWCGKTS